MLESPCHFVGAGGKAKVISSEFAEIAMYCLPANRIRNGRTPNRAAGLIVPQRLAIGRIQGDEIAVARFSGRIVNLGEQPVNPAGPELSVEVSCLPVISSIQRLRFSSDESIDGSGSQSPAKLERRDGAQPQFPIRLPITSLSASTMIAIQTVTYYWIDTAAAC
jgi:hypothetical protein